MFGIPIWVYGTIVLIFLCGYMAFRAMRAEQKLEQQFIEEEGSIYIKRMEEERACRKEQHTESS